MKITLPTYKDAVDRLKNLQERISLIATVLNEESSLPRFLGALERQSRLPDEVIVVDGGSNDGTVDQLRRAAASGALPIRVIEAPGVNIAAGRNVAISEAEGEIIAVTDAGTVPRPDWLQRLAETLEGNRGFGVASGFFRPGGETWRQRALATVITPQIEEISTDTFLPSSRSLAFRREWWERVGGYPEWLMHCEDLVFDMDMKDAGARFALVPEAIVDWDARPDLPSFARQYFNYARGDGHADLWRRRHMLRYGTYLVALPVLASRRGLWPVLAAAAVGYQAKFLGRLRRMPPSQSLDENLLAYAYSPVVVATGDVAKMAGYAIGTKERISGARGRPIKA